MVHWRRRPSAPGGQSGHGGARLKWTPHNFVHLLPGHYAYDVSLRVHDRVEMLAARWIARLKVLHEMLDGFIGMEGHHFGPHHLADEENFQRIDGVLDRKSTRLNSSH